MAFRRRSRVQDAQHDLEDRGEDLEERPAHHQREQDEAAVRGDGPHVAVPHPVRQRPLDDVGAVERGQRHEVEDRQQDVELDAEAQQLGDRLLPQRSRENPARHEQAGGEEQRQQEVGEGPRPRHDDLAAAQALEVAGIDRGGLGPAQERRPREDHQERHHHRPDHVDVDQRVEADPAEGLCRGVALLQRRPGVGRLVDGQAEEQHDIRHQAKGDGRGAQDGLLRSDETVMLARGAA
jgi:hypothetical protein